MDITDVRIRKVNDEGKMKAVVSITFDDEFVVHDIKIIEGQNGLFIAMPSRKMGEGDFRDIAHPLVSETRNKIRDAIFAEYEKSSCTEGSGSRKHYRTVVKRKGLSSEKTFLLQKQDRLVHMEMHPVDPGFIICSICLYDIYSTVFTRIRLVVPGTCRGIPALRTMQSPFLTNFIRCAPSTALSIRSVQLSLH